ncbi:alcohol dehydrogenase GroES domain protein [Klebsiella michiganensis]|uniref:Alcohol dehydrogenase GroES domain protein n=1 Tax=Klebsiella michiganensis TaxID=1134687 RepID=A0A7H4N8D5_9ENTR|nr:alcohol dehydrogenase GroES domain protein [Klebsiella michiganensis]
MTSMNTLVCQEPKILRWEKRQIPIPGDDEVLIKIKTVGICGTDIHAWGGNQPFLAIRAYSVMKYAVRLSVWVKIFLI